MTYSHAILGVETIPTVKQFHTAPPGWTSMPRDCKKRREDVHILQSVHKLTRVRNKILGQGDNFTGGAIRSLSDSPRTPTWNKFHKCLGSQPFPFRKWMCWSNSHSLSHLQHREPSIWNTKVQMYVYKKGVPEFSIRIWFNYVQFMFFEMQFRRCFSFINSKSMFLTKADRPETASSVTGSKPARGGSTTCLALGEKIIRTIPKKPAIFFVLSESCITYYIYYILVYICT